MILANGNMTRMPRERFGEGLHVPPEAVQTRAPHRLILAQLDLTHKALASIALANQDKPTGRQIRLHPLGLDRCCVMRIEQVQGDLGRLVSAIVERYQQEGPANISGLDPEIHNALVLAAMIGLDPDEWPTRVNRAIDTWEREMGWAPGPRVVGIDPVGSRVEMTDVVGRNLA